MRLRSVIKQDIMLLFQWANDSLSRKMSFASDFIPLNTHIKWFENLADSEEVFLYIAEIETSEGWTPVGQFRYDKKGEVSLSVCKAYRGQGLSMQIMELGLKQAKANGNVKKLIAHIKPENIASIKVFENAGFKFKGETSFKGHNCLTYIYEL